MVHGLHRWEGKNCDGRLEQKKWKCSLTLVRGRECACECKRESVCVCVWERERERERVILKHTTENESVFADKGTKSWYFRLRHDSTGKTVM